jgi:DNA (cytosine-5)-methyltransferase 1
MLKFADLFAGTGGIRIGFEQACNQLGIKTNCILSSEIESGACQTYAANFGEVPSGDIHTIKSTDIPDFDVLLAGFPCQPFSAAGKKQGMSDTRGTLFFEIERILSHKKPRYFFLENVRGLLSNDAGRTFYIIKSRLKNLGYSIQYRLLNASSFGIPQNRLRLYILGRKDGDIRLSIDSDLGFTDTHQFRYSDHKPHQLSLESLINPDSIRQNHNRSVVSDVLEDSPDKKYWCSPAFVRQLSNAVGNNFEQLHGYRLIDYRNGQSLHSWDLGIKGECTLEEREFMNLLIANRRKKKFGRQQDGKKLSREQIETFYSGDFVHVTTSLIEKGYLSVSDGKYDPVCGNMSFEVFKFLDPQGISVTLTASDSSRLGVVQRNIPRRITPRECARLQGFPETYKLVGSDASIYKQIGNAVPVPVVKALFLDFLRLNIIEDGTTATHV